MPRHWVFHSAVQEGLIGYGPFAAGPGRITGWAGNKQSAPAVTLRFARCAGLQGRNYFRDDWGALRVSARDCAFYAGRLGGYVSTVGLTNCWLDRTSVWLEGVNPAYHDFFVLWNCTARGGAATINRSPTGPLPMGILACALDGTSTSSADSYANDPAYTTYDDNAFRAGAGRLWPQGACDVVVEAFNWQHGWLGNFHLPAGGPLLHAGSLGAADARLSHHTVLADQTKAGRLGNGQVSVGFHYVAVDATGQLVNGDGVDAHRQCRRGEPHDDRPGRAYRAVWGGRFALERRHQLVDLDRDGRGGQQRDDEPGSGQERLGADRTLEDKRDAKIYPLRILAQMSLRTLDACKNVRPTDP